MKNNKITDEQIFTERRLSRVCECGRILMPCIDAKGNKIGVTHNIEDEDYHLKYFSHEKIMERVSNN